MSSLFGNNISQTYQGLIKLADSTTGVTSTTQSLQDGLGNNIPIQVSNNTEIPLEVNKKFKEKKFYLNLI